MNKQQSVTLAFIVAGVSFDFISLFMPYPMNILPIIAGGLLFGFGLSRISMFEKLILLMQKDDKESLLKVTEIGLAKETTKSLDERLSDLCLYENVRQFTQAYRKNICLLDLINNRFKSKITQKRFISEVKLYSNRVNDNLLQIEIIHQALKNMDIQTWNRRIYSWENLRQKAIEPEQGKEHESQQENKDMVQIYKNKEDYSNLTENSRKMTEENNLLLLKMEQAILALTQESCTAYLERNKDQNLFDGKSSFINKFLQS